MQISKKISETSIRVLETLKFLTRQSASIQDIIRHFEKIDSNNRIYTNEVILKYINTLKVFGFKFIKEKDKYVLLNYPLQFDFDNRDLKMICMLEKSLELFPEESIKREITVFLQELEKRFSDETRVLARNMSRFDIQTLDFDYKKYSAQIREYEQYCLDAQRLKLTYKNLNGAEVSVMVEPNEIKYLNKSIYLSVYNPLSAQIQDINFNSILGIEQLPLKSNPMSMYSSATFLLKGSLARAYKLHSGEKLIQLRPDGNIVIQNQKEDRVMLLKRLMKYGEYCEVLAPKNLKEEMKKMIDLTLVNYSK